MHVKFIKYLIENGFNSQDPASKFYFYLSSMGHSARIKLTSVDIEKLIRLAENFTEDPFILYKFFAPSDHIERFINARIYSISFAPSGEFAGNLAGLSQLIDYFVKHIEANKQPKEIPII